MDCFVAVINLPKEISKGVATVFSFYLHYKTYLAGFFAREFLLFRFILLTGQSYRHTQSPAKSNAFLSLNKLSSCVMNDLESCAESWSNLVEGNFCALFPANLPFHDSSPN